MNGETKVEKNGSAEERRKMSVSHRSCGVFLVRINLRITALVSVVIASSSSSSASVSITTSTPVLSFLLLPFLSFPEPFPLPSSLVDLFLISLLSSANPLYVRYFFSLFPFFAYYAVVSSIFFTSIFKHRSGPLSSSRHAYRCPNINPSSTTLSLIRCDPIRGFFSLTDSHPRKSSRYREIQKSK